MAILWDAADRTFTLHTSQSTYQMQIAPSGRLLHLYYGPRIDGMCLDYRFLSTDCGFSPNSYEDRRRRELSPDTQPQEFSAANTGDYRVPALECLSEDGVAGADLRYARHEIRPGKYALEGLPASFAGPGEAETLSVTLRDGVTGLEVELLYGVFPEADVLTRAALFHNRGHRALRLDRAASLCLDIPFGQWELLHFHGRHCMERIPERAALPRGIQTVSSRRGASSHHHNPFTVLLEPAATETQGACLGFMPVYSGSHRTDIELDQAGRVRVVSGINSDQFSWQLLPGERFTAPEVILCQTQLGLGDLTARYHAFLRRHLIPGRWATRHRPVLLNSWECMTFDFDAERLLAFAREAAELGVELVVLDDGWFGARDSDDAGLGDWRPNLRKLPGGLRPVSDAIHEMGMQFGLWVEPEMVNEDSDLYRAHPDWALTVPGRPPVMGRNQLALDMGRGEVVDYLYDALSALLRDNAIDYVKWDMNRNLADVYSRALPPHRQLEAGHRYILGVYALLERLTRAFPDVLFEGCAGGGGRFDAGMLYYTPQIWCSDDTDAIERLTIQQGTSVGYPVSAMGAHVSDVPNQQTGRRVPLGVRALTAMSGAFGYELDPSHLTPEEREQVREQVARYHRLEGLMLEGDLHRLTPLGDGGDLVAWELCAPDGSRALVNLVTLRARANTLGPFLRLRGLRPEGRYRLEEVRFEGCLALPGCAHPDVDAMKRRTYTGASLMRAGYALPPLKGDAPSAQLLFCQVE